MKKLMDYGADFIKSMSIWDMAVLKFCLISLGILIGLALPAKARKTALVSAGFVFAATYCPIMTKFLKGYCESGKQKEA